MAGKTIAEFLSDLAVLAGQTKESKIVELINSDEALKGALIPEEVITGLGLSNLMNVDAAKNNKDVSNHFKGRFLNDVDRTMSKHLQTLGLSKEDADALVLEKDSVKKLDTLLGNVSGKITDLSSRGEKMTDEEKKKLLDKINEFPSQLRAKDEQWTTKFSDLENKHNDSLSAFEDERISNLVGSKLSGYSFGESLQREDYIKLIEDKRKNSDFILKRVDGKLVPHQKANPDLKYFVDNKEASFESLMDGLAAPYLKKVEKSSTQQQQTKTVTTPNSSGFKPGSVGSLGADKIAQQADAAKKRLAAQK